MSPSYPCPGCIVEYLEDNAPKIAMVLEDSGGKLRLLLPGRRETRLPANRLLPWLGPAYPEVAGKEEAVKLLEQHQANRQQKAAEIAVLDLWELAQGEIAQARAPWFAELVETCPDADAIAAYGRALLACKSHFRFQPPEFLVYDADTVEKRLAEQKARAEREAIVLQGSAFLRTLWDVACKKRQLPEPESGAFPEQPFLDRIRKLLFARVANPASEEDEALWRILTKGLPDVAHLPLQLLIAWRLLPPHYNFWLDRADFASGDKWWGTESETVHRLATQAANPESLAACDLPFISIDGAKTIDIDDAFHLARTDGGYELTIALAAPALGWPFGAGLDKMVMHRATSIYLPEGDLHMLPELLGTDAFSLHAGSEKPAFCLRMRLDPDGRCLLTEPFLAKVRLAANLRFQDAQAVIEGSCAVTNPARAFREQLAIAHELALKREALRIADGAVVMLRQEPEIRLEGEGDAVKVTLEPEKSCRDSQRLVSEMMILASAALADWAHERGIALLHRSQNVALPSEYAGIWSRPEDLARIMRALIPSTLETGAKPHAALGLERYAQVTSPLRRYPDLVNEAQIIHYLGDGSPLWSKNALDEILDGITPALEAAGQVQRNRPRYWKLLWFKQQGDKIWHRGVITEENEAFVNVCLPQVNIQARGRRNMFDERARPGAAVKLRLGKVNPLLNEFQILEVLAED